MRTKMTENPVCPYCGHMYKGPLLFSDKEIKCGKIYEYDFYIFYSSKKKEK